MDPLSEALHGLRMNSSAFYLTEFSSPWALAMPAGCTNFYLVLEGQLELQTQNNGPISLLSGDFALILHDTPYRLASKGWHSERNALARSPAELDEESVSPRYRILRQGGGGELTRFFCGALRFDRPVVYELIRHLPEALVMSAGCDLEPDLKQNLALTNLIATEARAMRPGWETVCNRIADILIIQALRTWLADQPLSGWLAALQEPSLSQAIALMHREPSRAWSLAELAHEAAMSRSTFALRFRETTGETAMQYLTRARMRLALSQLREADASLSELAAGVGYSSEAAFHRAFKRINGLTPGEVRRQRRDPEYTTNNLGNANFQVHSHHIES